MTIKLRSPIHGDESTVDKDRDFLMLFFRDFPKYQSNIEHEGEFKKTIFSSFEYFSTTKSEEEINSNARYKFSLTNDAACLSSTGFSAPEIAPFLTKPQLDGKPGSKHPAPQSDKDQIEDHAPFSAHVNPAEDQEDEQILSAPKESDIREEENTLNFKITQDGSSPDNTYRSERDEEALYAVTNDGKDRPTPPPLGRVENNDPPPTGVRSSDETLRAPTERIGEVGADRLLPVRSSVLIVGASRVTDILVPTVPAVSSNNTEHSASTAPYPLPGASDGRS